MERFKLIDLTDIPIGVFLFDAPSGSGSEIERFIGVVNVYGAFYVPDEFDLLQILDPQSGFLTNIFRTLYGLHLVSPGGNQYFYFRLPKGFRVVERPFLAPPETSPHVLRYQAARVRDGGVEFRLFDDPTVPEPYQVIPYPFAVIRFPVHPSEAQSL